MEINPHDISYSQPEWDDGFLDIKAFWKSSLDEVGDIKCRLHDEGSFEIEDIHVRDAYPIPNTLFRKIFHLSIRMLNFQGISIGTSLLHMAIHEARKVDAMMIWGSVVETNPATQKRLLRWYAGFGFQNAEPDSRCLAHSQKKVFLHLGASSHPVSPSSP